MGDKKDIKEMITQALVDFAEEFIKPSFELVYEKSAEINKRFEKMENRMSSMENRMDSMEVTLSSMDRKLDLVTDKVLLHDKKISKLEQSSFPR